MPPFRLAPRLSLCFVSTFIRPFICMNSNYAERLSAVSAQTRILLPLEDEINARPINSTLPSSLLLQPPVALSALPLRPLRPTTSLRHPHTPRLPRTLRPCHLRRMILLDYTITANRLCLTFGSGWKMRFAPIADVVGFTLRPRRRLARQRGGREKNREGEERESLSYRKSADNYRRYPRSLARTKRPAHFPPADRDFTRFRASAHEFGLEKPRLRGR